jgi:predicted ATPase/class 3 adenylate cyclase
MSGYPSGLVTFLFTDIEGSTVRWEQHREAMQDALRRHDAILREAIEAHDGYVFKTIGDAFCAAFGSAVQAVDAAIAAQRRIGAERWDEVGGLRVRMALHSGETDERSGDYFGPPVNRVARLLATGHGGQVLLSGTASELVRTQLSADASLRHLGTLPLRDLKEPERVHQLVVADLPSDFKPLRKLETPPNNLPAQATSFLGRAAEREAVEDLLRAHRLVTIAGTGGMGKTRLAIAVASDLLNETSDGAWFVDLARIDDGALVTGTVLASLGAEQGDQSPLERLLSHLKKRSLLLVLDNCEHVIDAVARMTGAVLEQCPEIAVLATSREALNVAGECVYRLVSLELGYSIELFAERARAANPRFALDETNRETVASVCKRLDGMALAIELAAARTRSISLEDISRHLELRMLSGGGRDRLDRQQTMHRAIDWSYDLLRDEEKALFRRLSVFAGGVTLEAAQSMCTDEGIDAWMVLDTLASLLDKSLLAAGDDGKSQRYRFLEPVRQYARQKLEESGEAALAQQRHAKAFAAIADATYEEFDTDPKPDWLERNERELDNVRAALRWSLEDGSDPVTGARLAGGFGVVFLRLTLLNEGIGWCERALAANASLEPAVEACVQYVLSMLYNNRWRYSSALEAARRALDCSQIIDDKRGAARALSQIAQQLANNRRREDAVALSDAAEQAARGLGDPALLAAVLARCANVYGPQEIGIARDRFAESLRLYRAAGREAEHDRVLSWWADAELVSGSPHRAAELLEQISDGATMDIRMPVSNLAALAELLLGNRDRYVKLTREAFSLARRAEHEGYLSGAIAYVAIIAAERDLRQAAKLFGYAEELRHRLGWALARCEQELLDEFQTRLRRELGAEQFSISESEGRRWSDERALSVAASF